MPGSIVATGRGKQDNVRDIGSVRSVGEVRYQARLGTVGEVRYGARQGTIGEVRYQARLGTINALSSSHKTLLGTISKHTAVGSHYPGSWEDVSRYRVKTYHVLSSLAGSLFLVGGVTGTGPSTGFTGTMYKVDLEAGTTLTASFTESIQYVRAIVRTGSVGSGKGTLRLARSFRSL